MDETHGNRDRIGHRTHRIAAAFDTEAEAEAALHDLEHYAPEVTVVVHQPGCHDVDRAERDLEVTMGRSILIAIPLAMLALLAICVAFRSSFDLSAAGVIAVAVGPGAILGILFGGIAGLAISQRRLEEAQARSQDHRDHQEEVLVAKVDRGAVHNPRGQRVEYDGMRTREIVDDLETQIRSVFADHHGHPVDA